MSEKYDITEDPTRIAVGVGGEPPERSARVRRASDALCAFAIGQEPGRTNPVLMGLVDELRLALGQQTASDKVREGAISRWAAK